VAVIVCLSPLMLWVRIWIRVRCTTLCDKVCQWLATGQWLSPGPLVSSTNKTELHDIAEILLKVALNTINKQSTNHNACKLPNTYLYRFPGPCLICLRSGTFHCYYHKILSMIYTEYYLYTFHNKVYICGLKLNSGDCGWLTAQAIIF